MHDGTNNERPTDLDDALPLVYNELKALAGHYLKNERSDHTLQPTALVHEAYMRLVDQRNIPWHDRPRFFAAAANIIRRILVNHAVAHQRLKRRKPGYRLAIDESIAADQPKDIDLIALDEALLRLAELDPVKAKLVELRFFGGLTVEETADALGVSSRTVNRDWRLAKAWLRDEVCKGDDHAS